MSNCSFLLNPQQLSPRSLTSSRTTRPTSCCAASSRAGGSAGGQSRATVPLLTDLALVFLVSTGKKSRCKPLFKKKKKKRATSSSIWSVWTECFIYPHEHAVRRACPRHNVNFRSCFFFFFFVAYFLRKFTLYYFIFSVSLCQSECRLKSKPHDGDREKKKKKESKCGVVTSEILQGSSSSSSAAHGHRRGKKQRSDRRAMWRKKNRDARNQWALEGVFVIEHSSWIPDDVGWVLQ